MTADPEDINRDQPNPHFLAMVDCIAAARKIAEADPASRAADLLARALTATVNGRPAAARTWLSGLDAALLTRSTRAAEQPKQVAAAEALNPGDLLADGRSGRQEYWFVLFNLPGRDRIRIVRQDGMMLAGRDLDAVLPHLVVAHANPTPPARR